MDRVDANPERPQADLGQMDGPRSEPKLAYSVKETALLLSIGTDAVYELLHTRRLASAKVGRRRIISRSELERFLDEETQVGMAS